MGIESSPFGRVQGRDIELFTLSNAQGLRARVITFGATLVSLETPDRSGQLADVVLGFDRVEDYVAEHPYFGSTVGRYANRIAAGKITIEGREYQLATNHGPVHLHGGTSGFEKKIWSAGTSDVDNSVVFSYTSPDGQENYPGNLVCKVTYTLTEKNELVLDYDAQTDKATVVNLTHHSYFNLAGAGNSDILDHLLMINADHYTPTDEHSIPTGELHPVRNTPFDFTQARAIGARIDDDHPQLTLAGGYDHNYVLNSTDNAELHLAAVASHEGSGRVMEVRTTEPGMQFYAGNFLDGTLTGKQGKTYPRRSGFCLETQHFPDSPNQPAFPSTLLLPGQTYTQRTVYKFLTE